MRSTAWDALTRAGKPLTVKQLAKAAQLSDGGALTYLREWAAAGRLIRLPAGGHPAPYLDHYALPAPMSRHHPARPDVRSATVLAPTPAPAPGRPTRQQTAAPRGPLYPPATPEQMLTVALVFAGRGWHVFPLVPGQKRPAVKDWEARATTDTARIDRCWSSVPPAGPYGIGIACGPSGLVVIDLDQPKADTPAPPAPFDVPGVRDGADAFTVLCQQAGMPVPWETQHVLTGRGGQHLYFRHPTAEDEWDGPPLRNTAGTLGWLIDTRAHGGYVVAPPTTVNGGNYLPGPPAVVALLPLWLAKTLAPKPLPAQKPVHVALSATPGRADADRRARAYLEAALQRQVDAVTGAGEGGRNRALYLSALALGQLVAGGELNADTVTALLLAAAATVGLSEVEATRTITSGMRAGAKRPRTITSSGSAVAA